MATFRIVTTIAAPIEVCFDLARDIDFHTGSLEGTGERALAGRTSGLIGLGKSVTWEAVPNSSTGSANVASDNRLSPQSVDAPAKTGGFGSLDY
jgi:hypothetical protein